MGIICFLIQALILSGIHTTTPLYWEEFTAEKRERILEQVNPLVSDYHGGRFAASDDERTENLLNLLTAQQRNKGLKALYFSLFNRILMSSDGALAEMLGPYTIKMVCGDPEYVLTYFRGNKALEEKYIHSIGAEIYLSQGLSIHEGSTWVTLKRRILGKTSNKDLVEPFFSHIESFISILSTESQVPHIKPHSVIPIPSRSKEEYDKLYERVDESGDKDAEQILENDAFYQELYSPGANSWWWYCSPEFLSVKASSCRIPSGKYSYQAENAFDANHDTAWAEGAEGQGIGEYLEYEFAGGCPRITTVKIMNGYVKNETVWRENSRVKKLKIYYQGKPYAILDLQDSRTLQSFDVGTLGPHDENELEWKLRFEILEVYEGEKYDDTVISELFFDGIDVH